ncbi:Phosphoribosylaminoimidazole-succinocarboxamide synthase [Burkholderia cepacia]|nr:Phosphoribosylaminoimidazole-succinocarboxamide synthase [Burkholderia cepacia]
MSTLYESTLRSLPLLGRGKVRDNYAVGNDKLLIVTTDRLSAFDVVMGEPIPNKGRVLNQMANFWFDKLAHIVPNHLTGDAPEAVVAADEVEQVKGRGVVVKRLEPIMIEAVVRGYLAGSGWKEYQASGAVCGVQLPEGLQNAQKLPEPIFTPAAKAEMGEHDENITFEETERRIGTELAATIRDISIKLYKEAADYAATRGIIIADTKFEFGLDNHGKLYLMDEVLTADSSRFWPADQYEVGTNPPSFDKQFVRDWLEAQRGARRRRRRRCRPTSSRRRPRSTRKRSSASPARRSPDRGPYDMSEIQTAHTHSAPLVGVLMGSSSDWDVMKHAVAILQEFGVPYEAKVVSAHRMPDEMFDYAEKARERGLRAIIAGAGGAAHLPGMLAAKTTVPVLGVPVASKYLKGVDSLHSIVQMPKGVPVATFAIGEAGAANAALFAVSILSGTSTDYANRLAAFRVRQNEAAHAMVLPPLE